MKDGAFLAQQDNAPCSKHHLSLQYSYDHSLNHFFWKFNPKRQCSCQRCCSHIFHDVIYKGRWEQQFVSSRDCTAGQPAGNIQRYQQLCKRDSCESLEQPTVTGKILLAAASIDPTRTVFLLEKSCPSGIYLQSVSCKGTPSPSGESLIFCSQNTHTVHK